VEGLVVCALLALGGQTLGQGVAVSIGGPVPRLVAFSPADIETPPHVTVAVPGRDRPTRYEGVLLIELLRRAGAPDGRCSPGHRADAVRGTTAIRPSSRSRSWTRPSMTGRSFWRIVKMEGPFQTMRGRTR
jgi:hypothetical protein